MARRIGTRDADTLIGTPGKDLIQGRGGDDTLSGEGGSDTIAGGAGNDTVRGGAGKDRLNGGGGNDSLYGDAGNDRLIGGAGDDILEGGDGKDTYFGGPGRDVFILARGERILDFDPSEDERRFIDGPPPPTTTKKEVPDYFGLLERNQNDDKFLDNRDFEIAPSLRGSTRDDIQKIRENPLYENLPDEDQATLDRLFRIVSDPTNKERVRSEDPEEARREFLSEHPNLTIEDYFLA